MGRIKKYFSILIKAILAGICIGIGAVIYLSCADKVMGAFLFGIGLFTIIFFELYLYTGKVGYLINSSPNYLWLLLYTWIGNFIGTFITGSLINFTRIGDKLNQSVLALCEVKLSDNLLSIFILSIFCGLLMFIAVEGKKRITNPVGQIAIVFLPVMVFILSGFEHCIANMAYFTIANQLNLQSLVYLTIMTLGNSVGGMLIPLLELETQKLDKFSSWSYNNNRT